MSLTGGRTGPRALAAAVLMLGLSLGTGGGLAEASAEARTQSAGHTPNLTADGGKKERKPAPSGRSLTRIEGDWYSDPLGHRSYVHRQAVWGHRSQLDGGRNRHRIDGGRNVAIGFVDITGLDDVDTRGLEVVETAALRHDDPALYERLRMDERPGIEKFAVVPHANEASAEAEGNHSELNILVWDLAFLSQDVRKPVPQDRLFVIYSDRSPCRPRCAGRIPAGTDVIYAVVNGKGAADELNGLIDSAKASARAEKTTVAREVAAQKQLGKERKAAEQQRRAQARKENQFFRNPRAAEPCGGAQALGFSPRLTTVAAPAAPRSVRPAADPCGEGGTAGGLTRALTQPVPQAPGGIDFSSLELRHLSDPGDGSGLQYAFQAPLSADGGGSPAAGLDAAQSSSDAFFVWLSLEPSAFWVNLNPNEPDRIVDERLGRTDAGRVLLEADLLMKKTIGKLIHPHSERGRKFWDGIRGDCMSYRTWILPAPASIHQDGDALYILDAPLDVRMESQYLEQRGGSATGSCPKQDKATEDHNEQHFRGLILTELKKAINTAPEYAELRRVYLSRVAAEWYRDLSRGKDTTYGDLIDTGDVDDWRLIGDWKPTDTFDRFVESYTEGEFKVTDRTTEGGTTYVRSYVYGGVDFSRIPVTKVSGERFAADFANLPSEVDRSLSEPSADGRGAIWLGAPTPRQAAGPASGSDPGPGSDSGSDSEPQAPAQRGAADPGAQEESLTAGESALRVLPVVVAAAALLLWWRRRLLNTAAMARPRRRTAVPAARDGARRDRGQDDFF
ncbi:hypothetical protein ACH46N_23965 [Streptomyces pristinaespiralis]|nr:hypothetical protein [Streptomyces pristinaespiralis]ALC22422.1 LPXTG-motif cell wall anchor domain protein [Streptomyces pristinaespiralis]QMU14971.1 hypothetical protein H3L99_16310 [Streptomyces pristinaespiralis]